MAGGFNRVTLIGNLGDEPQVRPSQSGTSVATITLAINEYRRDQNGNKTESTEWVRVVAFGKNAEIIGQYLHKGSQVHIEGKLRTRSYDDKDGNKRYITEVVCDPAGLLMLGSKAPREDSYDMPQSNSSFKPQQQSNAYASNQNGNYGQYGQNNSHGFQINQNPQTAMYNQNQGVNNTFNQGMNNRPQNGYASTSVTSPYPGSQNNSFTQNPDNDISVQDDNELPF